MLGYWYEPGKDRAILKIAPEYLKYDDNQGKLYDLWTYVSIQHPKSAYLIQLKGGRKQLSVELTLTDDTLHVYTGSKEKLLVREGKDSGYLLSRLDDMMKGNNSFHTLKIAPSHYPGTEDFTYILRWWIGEYQFAWHGRFYLGKSFMDYKNMLWSIESVQGDFNMILLKIKGIHDGLVNYLVLSKNGKFQTLEKYDPLDEGHPVTSAGLQSQNWPILLAGSGLRGKYVAFNRFGQNDLRHRPSFINIDSSTINLSWEGQWNIISIAKHGPDLYNNYFDRTIYIRKYDEIRRINVRRGIWGSFLLIDYTSYFNHYVIASFTSLRIVLVGIGLFLMTGLVLYFGVRSIIQSQANRKLKWQLFKSRFDPHFIFNALASIQSLINQGENEKVNLYLADFSHLLRNYVDLGDAVTIPIEEDIKWLETYCRLESIRFDFTYQLLVDESVRNSNVKLPPGLVQPLVENSIKHGLSKVADPELFVEYAADHKDLVIKVRDNGPGKEWSQIGQGLYILKDRLKILRRQKRKRIKYSEHLVQNIMPGAQGLLTEIRFKNILSA